MFKKSIGIMKTINPLSAWQKLNDCGIKDRRGICEFHNSVFFV